ncbi:hypothetical protein [Pluralibacter gergoviae]|uniref:hypothetical protein n=1 Tax=Pluralibacter gergoviae TaxID=61647 RepID=UPI00090826A2|nr:hypothetical protein [Pluralibacter gergoviae]
MSIETILGAIATVLAMLAAAFGLGHVRGSSKAEAKAKEQSTEERAAATEVAAQRRVEATKGASDVQEAVKRQSDSDVDRQLRDNWTRPGGR